MRGFEMSKIIDLNFYRKFRIVLPWRTKKKKSLPSSSSRYTRPFRRRRRDQEESKSTQKD
ncbi:MAG: hypothetical protein A2X70_04920 [Alphaproteobacteria bacterium GWC2_42_16]|nr:MAG: hypothetical protein A2X70_04920 [Alphaproteobacteria bacterium GWC2_42_16]OFW73427.1 MAG: hypothetical protein A2Z80_06225 [Alphaproteobacteria bacterium GWA2_41_27]OFW82275.1 MAG: hypothetical protein A3E50_03625 [Alphaproteobacteria bacterium RIFCSPHIGHO2_12_FULL_42_100]OFW86101.1 MAG: hypothetical protein A2W06_00555 [Alphaproteobacteria bacterium RBG_16_42_14]OFW91660.1 MAG: hypothetical protein A3C41_00595 [Alphaproteobacteria bacterium RIFCSPHIGHO2_02_FULL_42_30]OFW92678.1 MAG: 